MKYAPLLLLLVLTLVGCNRPANQAATEAGKQPSKLIAEPVRPDNSAEMRADETIADNRDGEEENRAAREMRQRNRRQETPPFTVDEKTGEITPNLRVELVQTGCPDTCADFTFRMFMDYTYEYVGRSNVVLLGRYAGKADFNPTNQISKLSFETKFFELEETYPPDVEPGDAAHEKTQIYLDYRGKQRRVTVVEDNTPNGFAELETAIRKWIDRITWTPVDGK